MAVYILFPEQQFKVAGPGPWRDLTLSILPVCSVLGAYIPIRTRTRDSKLLANPDQGIKACASGCM